MSNPAPVTDWVHDFDHTDPRWTENPFPIWDELRAKCPIVHTDRFLGVYLPTTYEAVKEISYDTEHFSSRRVVVRNVRPEPPQPAPPITSDPPAHKPAKQILLPPFTLMANALGPLSAIIIGFLGSYDRPASEAREGRPVKETAPVAPDAPQPLHGLVGIRDAAAKEQ